MRNIYGTTVKGLSVFCTIAFIVYILRGVLNQPILLASISSTVFAIYFMPKAKSSRLRCVFGGHLTAAIVGFIIVYGFEGMMLPFMSELEEMVILGAASVTIAAILMAYFDVEHPPAAGTALTFAFSIRQPHMIGILFLALSAVVAISAFRGGLHVLERRVVDAEHAAAKWIKKEIFEH
ncbi:MAG: HPP family protein [archaeon]